MSQMPFEHCGNTMRDTLYYSLHTTLLVLHIKAESPMDQLCGVFFSYGTGMYKERKLLLQEKKPPHNLHSNVAGL